MKLKTVLFDMDGVLVSSESRHTAVCEELSRMLSHGRLGAKEVHAVGISTDDMYRRALEMAGEQGDPVALSRMHFDMTLQRVKKDLPVPDKNLLELLDALSRKGLTLAVVSSSPKTFVHSILDMYGLTERFSTVVTAQDVTRLKPDPAPYLLAMERLGLTAGETVAVEDSRIGSLSAKAAGLRCIGFINPDSGNQDLSAADVRADTYAGIGECVERYMAE